MKRVEITQNVVQPEVNSVGYVGNISEHGVVDVAPTPQVTSYIGKDKCFKVEALIDGGSIINSIALKLVTQLSFITHRVHTGGMRVADNRCVDFVGKVTLDVTVAGITIPNVFYIVPSACYDLLLGRPCPT